MIHVFFVKNCLSRRPYSDQGVATELSWRSRRSYVIQVEILCALTVLSLRVHGAHSACTALSRCCHCADAVLKTQWHLQEHRAVSVQTPRTSTAFAQRPLCARTELLLRCRRPFCAAMVTLRRPLCALLGRRANAE